MGSNVFSKGFGFVPKSVMVDTRLSAESKAIYAYLCSYADKKSCAFPVIETILDQLNISKSTYYKHLTPLIELKLIQVLRSRGTTSFGRNIYRMYIDTKHGYGKVPKSVMVDKQLSIKSKALYAYLCVFAGNKEYAVPKQDVTRHHLRLGRWAYYQAYNPLQAKDYITVVQRQINGKILSNEYYINKSPISSDGTHKGRTITVYKNKQPSSPARPSIPKNQIADFQIADFQIADFQATNNNSSNTNSSQYQQSSSSKYIFNKFIQTSEDEIKMEKKLKTNINYEYFKNLQNLDSVDEILFIIKQAICSKQRYLKVGRDYIAQEIVANKLWNLGFNELKHILLSLNTVKPFIYNRKAYLLTVLFNAPVFKNVKQEASYNIDELEKLIS